MAYIMDTNEEERAKGKTVEVRQIASARHVGLVGSQIRCVAVRRTTRRADASEVLLLWHHFNLAWPHRLKTIQRMRHESKDCP